MIINIANLFAVDREQVERRLRLRIQPHVISGKIEFKYTGRDATKPVSLSLTSNGSDILHKHVSLVEPSLQEELQSIVPPPPPPQPVPTLR